MTESSIKQLRCCIYARVSTDEQAERDLSIPFQLERCRYHAQGNGWEVVKEFIDAGESARTDKRPEFQQMITAARNREFDVILVHKFDRFARNDYDFIVYEKELEDLGVRVDSVTEPGDASTPAGYIGRRMMQVISTWYSKNLAMETKKGILKKVENGGWPRVAPLGYLNKREKNSAWIEVDPENGPLITKAFKEFSTGHWTLKEWAHHAYSIGYRSRKNTRIPVSSWSRIFNNRIYIGETYLRRGDAPTKGIHQPLIDPDTFALVQEILRNHDNYKQRVQRHKYLLQGLLYSKETKSLCWVEHHPKKNISYYRSKGKVDGKQLFYNTKDIDIQLDEIIRNIAIPEEKANTLAEEISEWFDNEDNYDQELKKAEARLIKLHQMEKNLQRLVIEDSISFTDFKEHRTEIEAERAKLHDLIDTMKARRKLVTGDFRIALDLAKQLDYLFNKGNFDEKRLICEIVFKRLYIEDGKITNNPELNSPFGLISSWANGSGSFQLGSGGWIRTNDLRVMSPTSFHCSTPRHCLSINPANPSVKKIASQGVDKQS
jgi:site-specific DNA recombinase